MRLVSAASLLTVVLTARITLGQTAPPPSSPYSLPWLMRPAAAKSVVRSDTSVGLFDGGTAVSSTLLGGVNVSGDFGAYAKAAFNSLSLDAGESGTAFSNPALIGLYTPQLTPQLRLSLAAAAALPVGQGGGNTPDPARRAAILSGISSRSGMENALFVPNYLTPFAGGGLAYIDSGLTLQGEVTVLELIRVKGEALDKDETRANFTSGIHAGYAVLSQLIASVELHYQRWLSTPAFVDADGNRREQATALVGVRVPVKAGAVALNPGLSYSRALDKPMSADNWQIVQLDLPVVF